MKHLSTYLENQERLDDIAESSYPLPKLSSIMETTKTSTETDMTSFLLKLQREQLYRKHQFHRFRQMMLQTTTSTSSSSSTMFHEDEIKVDIHTDLGLDPMPLTAQMKQRWDVLMLNHRKQISGQHVT